MYFFNLYLLHRAGHRGLPVSTLHITILLLLPLPLPLPLPLLLLPLVCCCWCWWEWNLLERRRRRHTTTTTMIRAKSSTTTSVTTTPTITGVDTTDDVLPVTHVNTEAGYNSGEAFFYVRWWWSSLRRPNYSIVLLSWKSWGQYVLYHKHKISCHFSPSLVIYSSAQSTSLPLFSVHCLSLLHTPEQPLLYIDRQATAVQLDLSRYCQ